MRGQADLQGKKRTRGIIGKQEDKRTTREIRGQEDLKVNKRTRELIGKKEDDCTYR